MHFLDILKNNMAKYLAVHNKIVLICYLTFANLIQVRVYSFDATDK